MSHFPADAGRAPGRIGPNALLQLIPVLDRIGGETLTRELFASAGVFHLPRADGLIDETPVARVHQELRRQLPDLADEIAWDAGTRTGDYIIANRIPGPVQLVLRLLPPALGQLILTRAITRHAWTFAGSGRFRVTSPGVFELADNPVIRGEHSDHCLCHWHAAVFERLFQSLVDRRLHCVETRCAATGASACRFELGRR